MPTRFLTAADDNKIAQFATTRVSTPSGLRSPIEAAEATGYKIELPTLAGLRTSLNNPKHRWGAFEDAGGALRAIILAYLDKWDRREIGIIMFLIDPSLSAAVMRSHRDDVMTAIKAQIPAGWNVYCYGVPAGASLAHQWFTAHWGAATILDDGRRAYSTRIEDWH